MAVFVLLEDSVKEAILTIIKYVRVSTGVEPSQEEIAEMLKSYFILNEVSNQVKYQLYLPNLVGNSSRCHMAFNLLGAYLTDGVNLNRIALQPCRQL